VPRGSAAAAEVENDASTRCSLGDGVDNEPCVMSWIETAFAPPGLCRRAGAAF